MINDMIFQPVEVRTYYGVMPWGDNNSSSAMVNVYLYRSECGTKYFGCISPDWVDTVELVTTAEQAVASILLQHFSCITNKKSIRNLAYTARLLCTNKILDQRCFVVNNDYTHCLV